MILWLQSETPLSFQLFFLHFWLVPRRENYLKCRDIHLTLQELFQSLTKLMKRLMETSFRDPKDKTVAVNLKMLIAEWIQVSKPIDPNEVLFFNMVIFFAGEFSAIAGAWN